MWPRTECDPEDTASSTAAVAGYAVSGSHYELLVMQSWYILSLANRFHWSRRRINEWRCEGNNGYLIGHM
jgi:hypothetical protein